MGINYYLKYVGEEAETKENVEERVEEYVTSSDGETIFHIGKSSGGWVFSWDMEVFRVWEKTGDNRWEIVRSYVERATVRHETTNVLIPNEVVGGITIDDLKDLLSTPGYRIVSECGYSAKMTADWFLTKYMTRSGDEESLMTHYKNQQKNGPSDFKSYRRDFSVAGQQFASYVQFC